jgi:hypothetical protein
MWLLIWFLVGVIVAIIVGNVIHFAAGEDESVDL